MRYLIAFLILCGVVQGQTLIHASKPIAPGNEVWVGDAMPESMYANCQIWYPFPKDYGATAYSFSSTNDCAVSGATWTSLGSGGMVFDGINDYLTAPSVNQTNFSVNVWFKFNSVSVAQTFAAKYDGVTQEFNVGVGGGNTLFFYASGLAGAVDSANLGAATNVWYFLSYSITNKNISFYINSIPVGSGSWAATLPTNNASITIGQTVNVNWAKGTMGEFMLFSTPKTAQDITNLFNQTKGKYGL